MKELGDKADQGKVKEVNDAIAKLKETLKGDDTEKIKADAEALTKPLHELTENCTSRHSRLSRHSSRPRMPEPSRDHRPELKKTRTM